MKINETSNFKGKALTEQALRSQAPSIYATGPMRGASDRSTFVPAARIVDGLRELDWVPVEVEEGPHQGGRALPAGARARFGA